MRRSGVDSTFLRNATLTASDVEKLEAVAADYHGAKLWLEDAAKMTVADVAPLPAGSSARTDLA